MFDVYSVRVCENTFYHLQSNNKIHTPVTTTQIKKQDVRCQKRPHTYLPLPQGAFLGGMEWKEEACGNGAVSKTHPSRLLPACPCGSVALGVG